MDFRPLIINSATMIVVANIFRIFLVPYMINMFDFAEMFFSGYYIILIYKNNIVFYNKNKKMFVIYTIDKKSLLKLIPFIIYAEKHLLEELNMNNVKEIFMNLKYNKENFTPKFVNMF